MHFWSHSKSHSSQYNGKLLIFKIDSSIICQWDLFAVRLIWREKIRFIFSPRTRETEIERRQLGNSQNIIQFEKFKVHFRLLIIISDSSDNHIRIVMWVDFSDRQNDLRAQIWFTIWHFWIKVCFAALHRISV